MQPVETHWPRKSAGQKMITHVPMVPLDSTIGDAQAHMTRHAGRFETINYIYVVDTEKKLRGVFSIKDLWRLPPATKVEKLSAREHVVTVSPTTHQEETAYLALKHNIKAIPVVDAAGVLLGVVPGDTILSILYKELREDVLKLAGIHRAHLDYDSIADIPLGKAVQHRLPWLLIGLVGGLLTANIVGLFEETLQANLILAAFIPLVVYMADAARTQLEAFTIRDLAVSRKLKIAPYLAKQFLIVLILSVILGMALFIASSLLGHDKSITLVLGSALVAASMSSLLTGVIVPLFFRKLKFDPANASGPIGTILQDITSVFIYFLIASAIL